MQYKNAIFAMVVTFFSLQSSYAQDWANLSRYQKENAQLAAPKSREQRVVFMGNSITEGWLKTRPEFFLGKSYINRGISGQTTSQMVLRFREDVIKLQPKVVVILAGINDIAENTGPIALNAVAGNIFSMAELAKENNIKVIMCTVLPASDFPWRPGLVPGPKVVALNAMLKKYANDHNLPFVDYYSPMVNSSLGLKSELGDDGVHPNNAGYTIMEPLVEAAIAKVLKQNK